MSFPHETLTDLGLTALEAEAYTYVLAHPASTGYGVAKGIGKPTANTYKSLASLHDKGAVTTGEDKRRLYRAVAPAELLAALEWRFADSRRRAAHALAALAPGADDGLVYHLRTTAQVIQRCRDMLARAQSATILELPDAAAPWVVDYIDEPQTRGVDVVVRTDAPAIAAAWLIPVSVENPIRLALAIDGREFLTAGIDARDAKGPRTVDAVWTAGAGLAGKFCQGLVSEFFYASIDSGLEDGMSVDELEETFARFQALRERLVTTE